MNPLALFPPPARAVTRTNQAPPPSSSSQSSRSGNQLTRLSSRGQSLQAFKDTFTRSANNGGGGGAGGSAAGTGNASPNLPASDASANSTSASEASTPNERNASELIHDDAPAKANTTTTNNNLDQPKKVRKDSNLASSVGGRGGAGRTVPVRSATRDSETSSNSNATSTSGGANGDAKLLQGLFFDQVRPEEVKTAFRLEREGFPIEDAATLEKLMYRQRAAPHLFLGAFLPTAPPKIAGPLSMSGPTPRRLIAYACATASSAMTARAMTTHSVDEHAWLVCLHSICVASEFRRKGLALKLLDEYVRRLQHAEQGKGDKRMGYVPHGYECIALLAHEELIPLYKKASFEVLGHSHVQYGSGGWFELRRRIVPKKAPPKEEPDSTGDEATLTDMTRSMERLGSSSQSSAASGSSPADARRNVSPLVSAGPRMLEGDAGRQVCDSPSEEEPPSRGLDSAVSAVSPRLGASLSDSGSNDGAGGDAKPASAATGSLPKGITQAKLLQALRSSSGGSGGGGGSSSKSPGQAFSSILGQALAAKTTHEEPYHALEARLVNREDWTNLADLYCPREECACKLVARGAAEWEMAEMGPLASPKLDLPNCPTPPAPPVPPPIPASISRVRSAFGPATVSTASTPIRGFWSLVSPMSFDNIGFSKDDVWEPPLPAHGSSQGPGSPLMSDEDSEGPPERGGSVKRHHATRGGSSGGMGSGGGGGGGGGSGLKIFRGASTKRREREEREAAESAAAARLPTIDQNLRSGAPVKVKYLLCPECDCGPLGYVVLSSAAQDGGLARSVGEALPAANGGGGGGGGGLKRGGSGGGGSHEGGGESETASAKKDILLYLLASDRLRYRFVKT